jgi:hypothetical protein
VPNRSTAVAVHHGIVYRAVVSLHACRSAVLKVPRHGSSNNLDKDFFERITADHYAFSGDAEHDNPEREALRMLLNAPWSSEKHSLPAFLGSNPSFTFRGVRFVRFIRDPCPVQ